MKKAIKITLAVVLPLMIIVGATYGLARIGVIPVGKLARSKPAYAKVLQAIGLYKPSKAPVRVAKAAPIDPLAAQKRALAAQQDALVQERAQWQEQLEERRRAEAKAKAAAEAAAPDPRNVARLASVYEEMAPETVTKIFAKMPDPQVIALLRRMDEKPVAQILATVAPERAARLTLALSRPAPASPDQKSAELR